MYNLFSVLFPQENVSIEWIKLWIHDILLDFATTKLCPTFLPHRHKHKLLDKVSHNLYFVAVVILTGTNYKHVWLICMVHRCDNKWQSHTSSGRQILCGSWLWQTQTHLGCELSPIVGLQPPSFTYRYRKTSATTIPIFIQINKLEGMHAQHRHIHVQTCYNL